jgi:hypothetical protein
MIINYIYRSRFYSCGLYQPFYTSIYQEYVVDEEDPSVVLDEEDEKKFREAGYHLPQGTYNFVANYTFFKVHKTAAISKSPMAFTFVSLVDTYPHIFPRAITPSEKSRNLTVVLQLNQAQFSVLQDVLCGTTSNVSQLQGQGITPTLAKCELEHSLNLSDYLLTFLGDHYKVNKANTQMLGKSLPYCRYATCQPDGAFYNEEKFVLKQFVFGASSVGGTFEMIDGVAKVPQLQEGPELQEMLEKPKIVLGEDKKSGNEGEVQAIVAMNIQATNLCIKAVAKGFFVEHAIIFGYARHVSEACVVPYRMHMNFMERKTSVYKGKQTMTTSVYFDTIKYFLDHPEELEFRVYH